MTHGSVQILNLFLISIQSTLKEYSWSFCSSALYGGELDEKI